MGRVNWTVSLGRSSATWFSRVPKRFAVAGVVSSPIRIGRIPRSHGRLPDRRAAAIISGQAMDREVFPPTLNTWIQRNLVLGEAERAEVIRHVMAVYSWPLQV